MNHGVQADGRMSARHGFASATASTNNAYVLSGETSVEVLRGVGKSVRLVVSAWTLTNIPTNSRFRLVRILI